MNGTDAYKVDTKAAQRLGGDPFYAEEEDDEMFYVFGIETGFAYAQFLCYDDAEIEADEMNERAKGA